ncbi:MAG: DUF1588 domain-containing protein [Polyangiaceae bacterium]|nr:DUF1588 domain-containing protein [Polyangiaceae bacterium]
MSRPSAPLLVSLLSLLSGLAAGCQTEAPPPEEPLPTEPQVLSQVDCQVGPVPGEAPARLLTRSAYENSVADILGDTSHPAAAFPPENQMLGFNNNAEAHQASPLLVSEMLNAAEGIAARTVSAKLDEIAPCPTGATVECGAAFIRTVGERLFRRPLTLEEEQVFSRLFAATLATDSYANAVSVVLQAMLQSPQFLYRIESVRPKAVESAPALLGPYEMATRLSYFLTDSAPDPELLQAASSDALSTPLAVEAQVRRLLQQPRARAMVANFHGQWLGTGELGRIVREDPVLSLPANFGTLLASSLQAFTDSMFWEKGTFDSLFNSNELFLDKQLGPVFGHTPTTDGFTAFPEPEQRFGLLTQPALMVALAHPNQTAPVFRGVFVREHFLCSDVPPPPPNLNAVAPDPDPKATTRERFKQHTASATCAACHTLIDPLGFGFENYDQLGRFRTQENGLPVDSTGAMNGFAEEGLNGPFVGPKELAARISSSTSARDCLVTQWWRYAAGRSETAADLCSLAPIQQDFRQTGALPEVLVKIALSDAFRYRAPYVRNPGGAP